MYKRLFKYSCLAVLLVNPVYAQDENALLLEQLQGASALHEKAVYTDQQLQDIGFRASEIERYRELMQSEKGDWWGHLEPDVFMAFAAEKPDQKQYYVNKVLKGRYPRANQERQTLIAFRKEAKKMAPDIVNELVEQFRRATKKQLFVHLDCHDCGGQIKQFLEGENGRTDLFFMGASRDDEIIEWATRHALPTEKVRLNHNNGLYERYFTEPLTGYKVFAP